MTHDAGPVLAGMLGLAALACTNEATLTVRDGRQVNAEIIGNDGERLLLAKHDHMYSLPRADVVSVDHPGTGRIVAGAVVLGVASSVAVFAVASKSCDTPDQECRSENSNQRAGGLIASAVFALPGAIILADGLMTRTASVKAYETFRRR